MVINKEQLNQLASKAWILPFSNNIHMAISEFEIVHILAGKQRYTHVPRSPHWCSYVFIWCDQLITLFDLNAYLHRDKSSKSAYDFSSSDIVCIVSYRDINDTIQYGSFLLSSLPVARTVVDEQICNFPAGDTDWSILALSCFDDPDFGHVPILDIPRIFCESIK